MPSAVRRPPAPAGVRWRSVQGGLTLLAVTFALLTLVAVSSRAWSISAAPASGEEAQVAAAMTFLLFGLAYQAIYSVLAALLGVAAVRITRAPNESGAVTPALIGAVGFGALVLIVVTLLSASTTPDEERQLTEKALSGFWIAAVVVRTIAVAAITLSVVRLARHLEAPFSGPWQGGLFALLAVDGAGALHGVLAPSAAAAGGAPARWALILVQLAFAAIFVTVTWRVRRMVRPVATAEAEREGSSREAPQIDAAEAADDESTLPPPAAQSAEPEISAAARAAAALLVGLGAGALPLWDAFDPRMRFEIDGPSVAMSGGLAVAGVLAALILYQSLGSDAYRARLVLFGAAVIGIGYAAMTLYTCAVQRSRLTDRLPVCESGEAPGDPLTSPLLSVIEGPRLESGVPCTRAAERRVYHLEEEPQGSFQDGLIQIGKRFAGDRPRFFVGTALMLLAFVISGVLVFRAAPESSADPDEGADDPARAAKRRKPTTPQTRE